MALHWNLEDIENHKQVCFIETGEKDENGDLKLDKDGKPEARMSGATETLIFGCMIVGLHGITEDNVAKFAARIDLVQRLHGDLMVGTDEDTGKRGAVPVKDEDVFAHIGLSCNVGDETDAAWLKRQVEMKRLIANKQREFDKTREAVEA